jgi:hypothetical protein
MWGNQTFPRVDMENLGGQLDLNRKLLNGKFVEQLVDHWRGSITSSVSCSCQMRYLIAESYGEHHPGQPPSLIGTRTLSFLHSLSYFEKKWSEMSPVGELDRLMTF